MAAGRSRVNAYVCQDCDLLWTAARPLLKGRFPGLSSMSQEAQMTTTTKPVATVSLTIDGRTVQARQESTVLEAARQADIYIPTLCYHPSLKPFGGCRLCIVEIEKIRGFPTSCTTPVSEGMVVRTDKPELLELRRNILKLILTEHPNACLVCERRTRCKPFDICLRNVQVTERCVTCPKNTRCELQDVADYIGLQGETIENYEYRGLPVLRDNPFFERDYNLCILCGRCVRVCQEVRGAGAVDFTYRGSRALVGTAFDRPLTDAGCQFCGACVDVCPTGALMDAANEWEGKPDSSVATICPYCGVGCQLKVELKDGRITRTVPDMEGPANCGQACVKGRYGIVEFVHSPERLTDPLVRKDGKLVKVSWEEALKLVAEKLGKYKGDQFAFVASAKATNEDNYVMQKFTRAVMQTNNVDHCARL